MAAFGGGRAGPRQGGDIAVSEQITLAQAMTGATVELSFEAIELCSHCHGNGAEPGTPIETCPRCQGAGALQAVSRSPFGQVVRSVVCDVCGGDGKVPKTPCEQCEGRGREVKRRTLSVDIPAGIDDGQRIRLAGRGHAGESGGPPGDLYVLVAVADHERFMRDGDDLVTVIDVPAPAAALGTQVTITDLHDGEVAIAVPAGTQPGEVISLPGRRNAEPAPSRAQRQPARGRQRDHPAPAEQGAAGAGPAARRLDRRGEPSPRRDAGRQAAPAVQHVIRLALRVRRADAEVVLAELLELAPSGVEEVDDGDVVEYAVYGAPGELPALPDLRAAAGGALVDVTTTEIDDDWADRWRAFHQPIEVGGRLRVRPPWVAPKPGIEEIVIDPGQAFGTGAHHTTRLCLELLCEAGNPSSATALVDAGCGSGVLAIAAVKLGYDPVFAFDFDPLAVDATRDNARVNGVALEVQRLDLRERRTPGAPTVVANLLRPLLLRVAADGFDGEPPRRLIASGLLAHEGDEVAAAFAAHGLRETARRGGGEWLALVLQRT